MTHLTHKQQRWHKAVIVLVMTRSTTVIVRSGAGAGYACGSPQLSGCQSKCPSQEELFAIDVRMEDKADAYNAEQPSVNPCFYSEPEYRIYVFPLRSAAQESTWGPLPSDDSPSPHEGGAPPTMN